MNRSRIPFPFRVRACCSYAPWTYCGSRGQRGLYSRVGVDAALVGETIRSYGRGTTNNGGGQNRFRYCGHGRIPLEWNALDNQLCFDSTPFDLKTRSANWSAAWHAALSLQTFGDRLGVHTGMPDTGDVTGARRRTRSRQSSAGVDCALGVSLKSASQDRRSVSRQAHLRIVA